jgi:pimeloyl-ACP methyl ester carboxylesterase
VRILWGEDDPYFPTDWGRRLSEAFAGASLTVMPRGRTFLPLDHPTEVGNEITAAWRHRDTAPREGGDAQRTADHM